jgi:hypothetical protein
VLRDPPDAAGDGPDIDAAIDATPDAAPLPCEIAGLTCGNAPIVFMCGGHCWARCTSGATWNAASTACTGWRGALGQIDDDTEQTCVAMRLPGAPMWIGLRQSDNATTPDRDWFWNTASNAVVYTHWQSGKPDDSDGRENRAEQCGKIQANATWDDVVCNATTGFFCERGLTQ